MVLGSSVCAGTAPCGANLTHAIGIGVPRFMSSKSRMKKLGKVSVWVGHLDG
jgi:hypothetical protein